MDVVSSPSGKRAAASRVDTPARKRIYELKCGISSLLREGCVSAGAIAKLKRAAQLKPELFGEYANL